MARLSLSRAWDETKAVLAAEGKLITSVALALLVLPAAIAGTVAPSALLTGNEPPGWAGPLAMLVALISLAGQVAITRFALGPTTTVGEAIGHGFRRALPAFAAAFLLGIVVGLILICVLFVLVGVEGVDNLAKGVASPQAGGAVLLTGLFAILIGARFQLIAPVATAERGGPIHLLKRSWALTRGHYWRVLAFLALSIFVLIVVILYLAPIAAGILVKVLFGEVEALSAGALVAALIMAAVQAVFSSILAVMLARIYAQLSGPVHDDVSVPSSGT